MPKMLRRRVLFIMPVDFKADTEEGLAWAIKQYERDPSEEYFGCHVDYGCHGAKRGRIKRYDAASSEEKK